MPTWLPPEIYRDKAFADKYLIENELGVGGAGVVVGARHRELDERVAIKFLLPGQSSEAVARFRREARAASRIKNQHVVRINDVSTTESGIPYIVMEYLEGVDLERMLQQSRNRQLPTADAIEFILQASEALAECHGLGIVHRDLKPSNLFCVHGADGLAMIKVLDFGISKLVATTVDGDTTDHSRILGSPRYMSPEQFDNSTSVDNRTDIWAIGVILYELLTGAVPFADTDMLKIWQKIRSQEPPPMARLRPDLPALLPPVIAKCLEKDRTRRYANLAELAKALLPFAPERSRASVARIVRTVEAPGTMTSALDLPPQDSSNSEAPTANSFAPAPRRRWTGALVVIGTIAAGIVLVLAAARPSRRAPTVASANAAPEPTSASAATTSAAVAPPSADSPATGDVVAPRPPKPAASSTASLRSPKLRPSASALALAPVSSRPGASPEAGATEPGSPSPEPPRVSAPSPVATPAASAQPSTAASSPFIVDIVDEPKKRPMRALP